MKTPGTHSQRSRAAESVDQWVDEALQLQRCNRYFPSTSRPGVALVTAYVQARATRHATETVGRALNRIAAALEALAQQQKR